MERFNKDFTIEPQKQDNNVDFSIWRQEENPWGDSFEKENIDKDFKRKKPTFEQITKMDKSLNELEKLFKGSNLNWHLDGALNISLMNGEYIGNHKDVDISININDLKNFEEYLLKNNYGLFLSKENGNLGNRVMQRIGYENFKETGNGNLIIAKIGDHGKIMDNVTLNNIDVHLIENNQIKSGNSEIVFPDKWDKAYPVKFKGLTINLSHPGKVLYYKFHQTRSYDKTDIERLIETGRLKEEVIDDIKGIYEKEIITNKESIYNFFKSVYQKINLNMSAEQIFKVLKEEPESMNNKAMEEFLYFFVKEIFQIKDFSVEGMTNLAINLLRTQKMKELDEIKQKIVQVK